MIGKMKPIQVCSGCFKPSEDIRLVREGWLCATCRNVTPGQQPQHGPITPSPMIDPEIMAEYRRSVEQFEARKDVPR